MAGVAFSTFHLMHRNIYSGMWVEYKKTKSCDYLRVISIENLYYENIAGSVEDLGMVIDEYRCGSSASYKTLHKRSAQDFLLLLINELNVNHICICFCKDFSIKWIVDRSRGIKRFVEK